MNWIITHTKTMPYHTYLDEVLFPLRDEIKDFHWLLSDLEYGYAPTDFPINLEDDYSIIPPNKFEKILNSHVQFYWGVIIAISEHTSFNINKNNLPYAEGYELTFKNGQLQHEHATMEIICCDSSYTIAKFADKNLSDKFKSYFGEGAIELEKFI